MGRRTCHGAMGHAHRPHGPRMAHGACHKVGMPYGTWHVRGPVACPKWGGFTATMSLKYDACAQRSGLPELSPGYPPPLHSWAPAATPGNSAGNCSDPTSALAWGQDDVS